MQPLEGGRVEKVTTHRWSVSAHSPTHALWATFVRFPKRGGWGHAVQWSVSSGSALEQGSALDPDTPALLREQLTLGLVEDARLKRALLAVLSRDAVPLPDTLLRHDRPATVTFDDAGELLTFVAPGVASLSRSVGGGREWVVQVGCCAGEEAVVGGSACCRCSATTDGMATPATEVRGKGGFSLTLSAVAGGSPPPLLRNAYARDGTPARVTLESCSNVTGVVCIRGVSCEFVCPASTATTPTGAFGGTPPSVATATTYGGWGTLECAVEEPPPSVVAVAMAAMTAGQSPPPPPPSLPITHASTRVLVRLSDGSLVSAQALFDVSRFKRVGSKASLTVAATTPRTDPDTVSVGGAGASASPPPAAPAVGAKWEGVSGSSASAAPVAITDAAFLVAQGANILWGRHDGVGPPPHPSFFPHAHVTPLEGSSTWTSIRSFSKYPSAWRLVLGVEEEEEAVVADNSVHSTVTGVGGVNDDGGERAASCDESLSYLTLTPLSCSSAGGEFLSITGQPAWWHGAVTASGVLRGERVHGSGFVCHGGFAPLKTLDAFFSAVGSETRRAVSTLYPDVLTPAHARELISTYPDVHPWHTDGVDLDVCATSLLGPVRYITDVGGKSWRSYGALAAIEACGQDSTSHTGFLALAEFLHVGSLIVDDIQDRSAMRRGVPCAHLKYGEPTCINAATAAYFACQVVMRQPDLTPERRVRLYDYYFGCLRAGHAGQALDIAGLDYLITRWLDADKSPDALSAAASAASAAEGALRAIHRLKTGVPAASLVRMGAVVGGGSDVAIEGLGCYFESIGIAFQIMDDVLNLRGIYSGAADKTSGSVLKTVGEDISAGKVTFPIVKALTRMPRAQFVALWNKVSSRTTDRVVVDGVIAELEACGAIDACVADADALVEGAYAALDSVVPDSFAKMMLHAFGYFITQHSGG